MPLPGLHLLASLGLLGATAAKKTSGGSSFFLIFLIVIAGVYLLFIAPQRRKQRAQMAQQKNFEVGDEVVTTGGIYGRVDANDGERVTLDIADGVFIEVAKTAIARRVEAVATEVVADTADSEADEDDDVPAATDWDPPASAEVANTNTNGASTNGNAASRPTEWGEPWSTPPADGEKGAPGAGGSV